MSSTLVNTNSPIVEDVTKPVDEIAKGNLYYLLSKAFSSPQDMDEKLPEQLRLLICELPKAMQPASHCLADEWERALKDRKPLTLAYARLFLGPFEVLASPYASFYLEPGQQLMGEVSQHVADTYAKAGIGPGKGPREVPDHAALEWEFMYYLTHQFLTTNEEQWIEQRKKFYSTHLKHWMPSFVTAITEAGEHEFYNAVAVLITALQKIHDGESVKNITTTD